MSKPANPAVHVGVDVSAEMLAVALQRGSEDVQSFEIPNSPDGFQTLLRRALSGHRGHARCVVEATGLYSLDLALHLDRSPRVEVMVANPRAVRHYAKALMRRAKTDSVDACLLLNFAQNFPFKPWKAPAEETLTLRAFARRIRGLTTDRAREKNRLHAISASNAMPQAIRDDIEANIEQLNQRVNRLEAQTIDFIKAHPAIRAKADLVRSVPGIAWRSTIYVLGELLCLDPEMDARQLVAHAGLDPRPFQSGTSVHATARISKAGNKYLRAALYMPAVASSRSAPEVQRFYKRLEDNNKRGLQPMVAVMRKLLHVVHGVLRTETPYNPARFSPNI